MQQPQFYKTVPVSERPKKDGYYQCLRARDKSWYELYFYKGQWYFYEEEAIEGYDHVDPQSYTHYLEPIPIPDAEVLRMALSDISEMIDTNRQPSLNQIRAIAREALSNTSDGWVRVGSAMFPDNDSEMWWAYWESSGAIYPASIRHGEPVHYSNQVPISPKPTHMKKATLPSPPQPINP